MRPVYKLVSYSTYHQLVFEWNLNRGVTSLLHKWVRFNGYDRTGHTPINFNMVLERAPWSSWMGYQNGRAWVIMFQLMN